MKLFSLIIGLVSFSLNAKINNVVCIDNGGSKTVMQIINLDGQLLPLTKNNETTHTIIEKGGNINTTGKENIKTILESLVDVKVDNKKKNLRDIIKECQIIGSFAGAGAQKTQETIAEIFINLGIPKEQILIKGDAQIALDVLENDGVVLISGTGSVCFGKKNQNQFRVGGLGRVLGDEGSGYFIGIQALKAALAHEYGWGVNTSLINELKKLFDVPELKQLIRPIMAGEITPGQIASSVPIVFEHAFEKNDPVAQAILDQAAQQLREQLATMLKISQLSDNCHVHVWGGIFKSKYAEQFIKKVLQDPLLKEKKLIVINQSNKNAALLFAQKWLLNNKFNKTVQA